MTRIPSCIGFDPIDVVRLAARCLMLSTFAMLSLSAWANPTVADVYTTSTDIQGVPLDGATVPSEKILIDVTGDPASTVVCCDWVSGPGAGILPVALQQVEPDLFLADLTNLPHGSVRKLKLGDRFHTFTVMRNLPSALQRSVAEKNSGLKVSGPIVVTSDNQIIENVEIVAGTSDECAIRAYNVNNLTIRNVLVQHANKGLCAQDTADLKVSDAKFVSTSATSAGPHCLHGVSGCINNSSQWANPDDRLAIKLNRTTRSRFDRIASSKASGGMSLYASPGVKVYDVICDDIRGPYPRGQCVQFVNSNNALLKNFSTYGIKEQSRYEDNINIYNSDDVTVSDGLIDGNFSVNGVGVIADQGSDRAVIRDIDLTNTSVAGVSVWSNSSSQVGNNFLAENIRIKNTSCSSRNGQTPSSGGLVLASHTAAINPRFNNVKYFNHCRDFTVYCRPGSDCHTGTGGTADIQEQNFTLRAPLTIVFPFEEGTVSPPPSGGSCLAPRSARLLTTAQTSKAGTVEPKSSDIPWDTGYQHAKVPAQTIIEVPSWYVDELLADVSQTQSATTVRQLNPEHGDTKAVHQLSENEASRLLAQSSFGATPTSIEYLQRVGANQWVNEQLEQLPSPRASVPTGRTSSDYASEAWWNAMINDPDQLRQRVALSLSALFAPVSEDAQPLAEAMRSVTEQKLDEESLERFRFIREHAFDNILEWLPEMDDAGLANFERRLNDGDRPVRKSFQPAKQIRQNIAFKADVAALVSEQLITSLVTQLPADEYRQIVLQQFHDNGEGQFGNLGAVVKAILLDNHARQVDPSASYGIYRLPVLQLTHFWKAFGAYSDRSGNKSIVLNTELLNALPAASLHGSTIEPATERLVHTTIGTALNNWQRDIQAQSESTSAAIVLDTELEIATDPTTLIEHLDTLLVAGALSDEHRYELLQQLAEIPDDDAGLVNRVSEAISSITQSADYLIQM